MIEELQQFDDSALNSLLDLRRERDALRQRLARMQEAASDVSEQVLARVRGDYEARIAALDDKATPLKDAARGAYGRLTPLLEKARAECETLRLDREEIELRHRLGEFDEEEYRAKSGELDDGLKAALGRSTEISDFVARFLGAFDSPDELAPATTSQLDIPVALEAAPSTTPATAAPAPAETGRQEEDGTLMLPLEPPPSPEPPPAPSPVPPPLPASSSPEPPVWVPKTSWSDSKPSGAGQEEPWRAASAPLLDQVPPVEPSPSPAGPVAVDPPAKVELPVEIEPEAPTKGIATPAATGATGATGASARARLEALDPDLEPQPHFLEPLTFIGRTPENQIRIYKPAVSRRHAQITETDAGWMLRDLSSENGTYVNGQRITERLLGEGDRVQFGTSRFVLRLTS